MSRIAHPRTKSAPSSTSSLRGQSAPPQSPSCGNGNGRLHASEAGVPFPFIAFPQQALNPLAAGKIKLVDVGVLLVILKFRQNGQMTAWVKTETIVRLTGVSEPTVHRSLRRLAKAGLASREACKRPDPIDPKNRTGFRFVLLFQDLGQMLGVSPLTVSSLTVSRVTPNSDGRKHSDGRKQEDDDDPETSSSSFAALPNESGGTGGTNAKRSGPRRDGATPKGFPPAAEPIDPRRLTAAVARVVGLKLRRHESDPGPMDAAAA